MADEKTNPRLQELGGSGYEVADGQPDIKGWDVRESTGKKVGEVDELIFDEMALKVRYLVLDIDSDDDLDLESRDVLIPIGLARLDDEEDEVILSGVTVDQLRMLPEYDEDNLNSDMEYRTRNILTGVGNTTMAGDTYRDDADFYNHEYYNDDNLFSNRMQDFGETASTDERQSLPVIEEQVEIGKREIERGGIRLRSRVIENDVEETVNLREEKVNVQRTPTDRPASERDIQDQVIEVSEKSEVPVVKREARVVEEVSVNKDVNERQETVRDKARRTEVDVEKMNKKNKNNPDMD